MADDGGSDDEEFWVSDGTIPGTFRLTGTGTPAGELDASNANATITVGNQVFFTAYRPDVGTELFVTDGTINGTHLVADLFPGTSSSAPRNFSTDGTYLYFSVSSGPDLEAVWVSDGTEAGTQIISVPGGSGSTSASMITVLQLEQENLPPRTFLGTTGPDTFNGEFLDEIFYGLNGDDTLNGGLGDDTFYGGPGADDIDGGGHGAGGDTASYQGSDAAVTINLGNGAALGGHAAGDTLTGIENVEGSDHADTIYGDAGNNVLRGGAGDDTLAGQGGDDQLFGSLGNDSLSGGNDNDTIHGEDGNDRIFANAGNDIINGGAGDDFTNGGDGDDTINGGADDDNVLVGGNGSDTIHGDDGSDGINGSAGDDFLYGDLGNDRIYGGTGLDQMWGGEGDDTMGGLGDDDQMWGGDGADGMNGGGGNDDMFGEAGNDRLFGGLGADTLVGGADDDLLVGQGGIDTFVFEANWGHDQISGYGLDVTGQAFVDEVIDMSALGIGFGDLTIQQSGNHTLVFITANGSATNSIEILYRNAATITQSDFVF